MAQALYRRYRPDTFADMIGQEHVSGTLMAALDGDRTSHAYLFSGPRGCGKTTSARIMARCLNCAQGPTSTPCGECESCIELASGGPGSLDVIEMDAASNRGIDDARDLRERAEFAPVRDRYKVVILDEAHMVTKEGANALLKLIEEPPAHVKFIFATTEPEKMLPTIRSRTHQYQFRLVPPQVLSPYLLKLCEKEGVTPEPGVLELVVRAGAGSVRDSLSVLDQLLAGAEDGVLPYERSAALLGYTSTSLLDRIVDALGQSDGGAAFQSVEDVVAAGVDPKRFTEDLLQRLRDLIICSLAPDQAAAILAHVPAGELEQMKSQSAAWGSRKLSQYADIVEEGLAKMVGAAAPRLMLELLVGRLLAPSGQQGTGQPVQTAPAPAPSVAPHPPAPSPVTQVPAGEEDTLEKPRGPQRPRSESTAPALASEPAPAPASAPPVQPVPSVSSSTKGVPSDPTAKWGQIADAAAKKSAVAGALIRDVPVGVSGSTIYIQPAGPMAARLPQYKGMIDAAIEEVVGSGWTWEVGSPPPKAEAPTAAPASVKDLDSSAPENVPVAPSTSNAAEPTAELPRIAPPAESPAEEPPVFEPVEEDYEPYHADGAATDYQSLDAGDMPSMDDENLEVSTAHGVSLVLEIFGGTVVDDGVKGA